MSYKKGVFRNLALITQLGIQMLAPVFICIFVGLFLDKHFGTKLFLVFLVLGFLAGGRNMYMMARHSMDQEKKEDEEDK